jgi:2-hydroxyacyl-CoA lyase 1
VHRRWGPGLWSGACVFKQALLLFVTSLAPHAAAAGVCFVAFRNEQSAGYAAAYDFLTGSSGAFLTVSGPGCVHGLAGLSKATAWSLLVISGSCDQADAGRGDFQELD